MCLRRLHVFCAVVRGWRAGRGLPREAFVWILPAQKPTAVFSALPLRGRSRTDTSPVRTGRKAASSKNPAVIFAWDPGKIQTKSSTPRPADGGHDRAIEGGALRGGGGGATSDGRGKGFRVRGSGKAPKGARGDCRCARWAHWFGGERNSLCVRRAQLQDSHLRQKVQGA